MSSSKCEVYMHGVKLHSHFALLTKYIKKSLLYLAKRQMGTISTTALILVTVGQSTASIQ